MFELFTSKTHLCSLLISCLFCTCSFIFSHLLYFSYFIYFSPYLLKLVKFLPPLLIFTFLVLLTGLVNVTLSSNVIAHLDKSEEEEDTHGPEDLEMYKVFFGSSEIEVKERQVEVFEGKLEKSEVKRNSIHMNKKQSDNFSKILNQFERMSSISEENKNIEPSSSISEENKNIEPSQGTRIDKVVENHKAVATTRHGFEVKSIGRSVRHDFGTHGSMRKENEWNRTLACKLFEERRNYNVVVEGDEGMDSLWESSYANDFPKNDKKKGKRTIKDEFNEDDDDEEEGVDGQLCCLQAFKLKLSLGVGIRPNLVKISKAIKGIGWLHHVKKHSKKVHNNKGD